MNLEHQPPLLGSLFQCLTICSVKKMLPNVQSKPLSDDTLNHSHASLPGRRIQHLPFQFTSSKSCKRALSLHLSFLFSKLEKLKVLSPSSQATPSSSLTRFVAPPQNIVKNLHNLSKFWGPELHTSLKLRPQRC